MTVGPVSSSSTMAGRGLPRRSAIAAVAAWACIAGGEPVMGAELSDQDKADVARVETYLNTISTLKARFIQVDRRGEVKEGEIFLERPDKMRMEYDPPFNMVVVAFNGRLDYHDPTVPITSFINISLTPMADLAKPVVKLSGKLHVEEVTRTPGSLRLTLAQSSDSNARKVVITLADNPLELRQWSLWTKYGEKNRITLMDPEWGNVFEPKLFWFVDPMESQD